MFSTFPRVSDLENIASVLAGRYVIARETAKRQKARTMKEEDQDMKSIQVKYFWSVFMFCRK